MKVLVYSALRTVTLDDWPVPAPGPDEVLLRVRATGICGSDLAGFLGYSPRRQPGLVLGHETVGIVEAMPSDGEWPFQIGQRVVVNPLMTCGYCDACLSGRTNLCAHWHLIGMDRLHGAFAEYVVVRATNVFPIPEDLPDVRAVMIEPLANGVHLFTLITARPFSTLALFGAGTQGCLLLLLARMLGYRDIAVVDVNPERLKVAAQLGARWTIHAGQADPVAAIHDCFGGNGADVVIDAHGDTAVRSACVNVVRKGGEVLLLGLHEVHSNVDFARVVRGEVRLQGSYAYTTQDFAQARKLVESGSVDLSPWTEVLPLEAGQTAFDRLTTDPGATVKIVLTP
ncbi:MAG: alcohol dehydrogenase catalytic domain-containing protein [Chloroherpetonaceae bacterium]|nr:alcohol dehydrogenase catalytic domain-containing protein [Chthonomonadaceae bacterium]MDW8208107.1 alcohol dehydrogenase catalytic domain-containing protein [Chloroherpetonaceae bacterium]